MQIFTEKKMRNPVELTPEMTESDIDLARSLLESFGISANDCGNLFSGKPPELLKLAAQCIKTRTVRFHALPKLEDEDARTLVLNPILNPDGNTICIELSVQTVSLRQRSMIMPEFISHPLETDTEWVFFCDKTWKIEQAMGRSGQFTELKGASLNDVLAPGLISVLKGENAGSNERYHVHKEETEHGHMVLIRGANPFMRHEPIQPSNFNFIQYLLDNIPTDIAVWTLDHRYLYLNKMAVRNDELRNWLMGKTDFDYVAHRNQPVSIAVKRRTLFNQALASDKPLQWEETLTNGNEKKHLLRVYDTIRDSDGNPAMVIGYAVDITQTVANQSALRELQIAADAATDGIALCDVNGEYYYMNRKHARIFHYQDSSELLGKSWKVLYGEKERKRIAEHIFPLMKGTGKWMGQTTGIGKDGAEILQEISLTAMPEGQLLCICRDISDRLVQEKEISKLALVAEKTNSAIVITNNKLQIEWVNEAFVQLTGYSQKELAGKTPGTLKGKDTDRETLLKISSRLRQKKSSTSELITYRKNGEPIWISLNISPVYDPQSGELLQYISVLSDITLKKQAEMKLIDSLAKEKELSEMKTNFVNLASHEIRTPLMAIQTRIGISRMIAEEKKEALLLKQLDLIEEEMQKITQIMDKVLMAGKLNQNGIQLNLESTDLKSFLMPVIAKSERDMAMGHSVNVIFKGQETPVMLDKTYATYIFQNLLSNAQKYSPAGSSIEVAVAFEDTAVRISVTDKGIGIPKKDQSQLFDAFFRASNATNIRGTGLGLYLVSFFTQLHGGTVEFSSREHKGSTFAVTLPLTSVQTAVSSKAD